MLLLVIRSKSRKSGSQTSPDHSNAKYVKTEHGWYWRSSPSSKVVQRQQSIPISLRAIRFGSEISMNMSNRTKAILITAILGSGVLVACGTSASAPGGSASIALAQAHATATAEVAQTATAMIAEANRRNEEALARMTAVASAGMQSTLTVQEQQINDLAIAQAKANATQQAQLFRATATAISVQKTAQADMYTATAVAVRQNQNDAETTSRFWSYLGFVIILLLVFGAGVACCWLAGASS